MRTFGDVLGFLRQNILRDTEKPYLWADGALCECIAQAHDEFAERTRCIRDSSSIAASFYLEEGVDTYVLHPTVQAVLSAKVDGADGNLIRSTNPALDGYAPSPDVIQWLEAINNGATEAGTPKVFSTDESVDGAEQAATIRVYPIPTAADDGKQVKLRIQRLPITQCSPETLDQLPECPRQSLMGLVHGSAAYAYALHDSDGNDDPRADKQRVQFERFIKQGSANARSKLFQPLAWGFGRGGFTTSR